MIQKYSLSYSHTIRACFTAYIVQAIVNNFAPLLFLTFQSLYGIPLSQITLLITFNFCIQLLIDALSARFIDKIGYRASIVTAHACSAVGLVLLAVLILLGIFFAFPLLIISDSNFCHQSRK